MLGLLGNKPRRAIVIVLTIVAVVGAFLPSPYLSTFSFSHHIPIISAANHADYEGRLAAPHGANGGTQHRHMHSPSDDYCSTVASVAGLLIFMNRTAWLILLSSGIVIDHSISIERPPKKSAIS